MRKPYQADRMAMVVGFLSILALLGFVEILIRLAIINPYIVPLPTQVAAALVRIILEEDVGNRILATASEVLAAATLVVGIGVPLGVALHRLPLLRAATQTWIAAMSAAPIGLMYPLFLVILGRNMWTIVAIGTLAGLPPVSLKTLEGISSIRPVLLHVGSLHRLNPWQQFFKILLPAAVPGIFAGLRIGLIFAMINVVGMEFLINFGGIGPLISELSERYDMPGTYAAILVVILLSVLFFIMVERLEQWMQPVRS